jgi:hypothetical protein
VGIHGQFRQSAKSHNAFHGCSAKLYTQALFRAIQYLCNEPASESSSSHSPDRYNS